MEDHGDLDLDASIAECSMYELEQQDYRVISMEIGYLDETSDSSTARKGVIWLRFVLRELMNAGPTDSDKTIILGRSDNDMRKQTLKFTQQGSFLGFTGTVAPTNTSTQLATLGAVSYKCGTEITYPDDDGDKTWWDKVVDFYNDHELIL